MSLVTNWGYTLLSAGPLSLDMLSEQDFNELTSGKYAADSRTPRALMAAQQAVRDFVGWHLFPAEQCEFSTTLFDSRVTRMYYGFNIQLPAKFVTGITSVSVGGKTVDKYHVQTNGTLRVFCSEVLHCWDDIGVTVQYTAGLPNALMGVVRDVVASRAVHAMTNPGGIASESAGGVSVSYSQAWISDGGAGSLTSTDAEALRPYKLKGVF